ncbi:IS21 family transposase [Aquibacillus salsiterrae]|uniref:IS21 family transposase n=1 Tax=Aquibacillus salsiterrae TaxID=2950439 RepID=A0A9X3WJV8_9BACI|nr:IS21 family transposase [Aquibacillus salsiterrae]MDC3418739.1 IS21 family transposase [Aquibacillus salsiterrae]
MINLKNKQEVLIMYLREGRSQREIAKKVGIDRKTVSKYIKEYESQRNELNRHDIVNAGELIQTIVDAPRYRVGTRPKRVLTKEIEQRVQELVVENEEKRRTGLRKQQKKPIDIHQVLEEEGFTISYSTVLRTIRELDKKPKEAYIKGSYLPGDICEFDWGEVKITINGKRRVLQMAVFTSAFGNYRMAYLFTKQKTECFQEAHALFFEKVGGVYKTMVYDNMKVAVKRFVGTEKEPTEGLLKLSIYYTFNYRFCNVRRGNEKGHVERSVEVIRRKAFAFKDSFETLEEANQYLLEICEKLNQKLQTGKDHSAEELFEQEKAHLLPNLPQFDAARIENVRVDKYSTIVIDQNHYSVPDHLVNEVIMTKIYSNRIQCFSNGEKIAEHHRLTGGHEWRIQLDHYLNTLKKKPGALASSVALQQADKKIKNIYDSYYINNEKGFIELIHYLQENDNLKEVEQSINELHNIHPSHVTTDKIKVLCARNQEELNSSSFHQDKSDISTYAREHLRAYDELFQTNSLGEKGEIA